MDSFDSRIERFLEEMERDFDATREVVLSRIAGGPGHVRRARPIWVVECSMALCAQIAREISQRTGADARGWPLSRLASLPPGPVVSTHFHTESVENVLHRRADDPARVLFIGIQPDMHTISEQLRKDVERVVVCDLDAESCHVITGDLRRSLVAATGVDVEATSSVEDAVAISDRRTLVLFSPGTWDALPEGNRIGPASRCLPVRINPAELTLVDNFVASVFGPADPTRSGGVDQADGRSGRDRR